MFSLTQPPRSGRRPSNEIRDHSPFSGSPEVSRNRAVGLAVNPYEDGGVEEYQAHPEPSSYFDRNHREEEEEDQQGEEDVIDEEDGSDGEDGEGNDNEDGEHTPLLPIFSAAHLDRLPLYNITHAIRLLIVQRCETTLSWDQLRSPQVSQFLVKPIQVQIRANHFNRATLCALAANGLQFHKECQVTPGNVGVLRTRALMSELLAMRLIKEFTVRELIDVLSYDFDPLRGMSPPPGARDSIPWAVLPQGHDTQSPKARKVGRVSTIEIAIKAQAKRFLAHPLVVQHLEAIWAGTVVFHSEADNLHRKPPKSAKDRRSSRRRDGYGTIEDVRSPSALPADSVLSRKAHDTRTNKKPDEHFIARRAVTLYDPREASLFKLSRLRVPRYRQMFSTVSFAVMLGLYIAVLVDRSLNITPLEVLFWIWSIGYMLDEVIGFTEQGFGLYILSFWNAFDLGILLLFVVYYALRLYGIVLADEGKHHIASMSYDVLGSTAVLLFPRLFSVLDHYRYFSQLLIAFRMMSQDLLAILVLIVISCSGFFVAFTLSFSDDETDASAVAYALFQLLMGFTPAAWEKWSGYNALGKIIMTIFLVMCHFLIVTILITVLTNSFMAIVQNASEEHQFLFAINTLSMVKSDMLFSYIAPSNVIGWLLSPLRYVMPFRQFVRLNRTIIKLTHFPVLWAICVYERLILSSMAFEPTDLVEKQAKGQRQPVAFSLNKVPQMFSPGRRLREPSVISFQKDLALEEVFRRPFRGSTVRTTAMDLDTERRNSQNVVDKWMEHADEEGGASPPLDQPRSVVERLEHRRPTYRRAATGRVSGPASRGRDVSRETRSVASDPDIFSITAPRRRPDRIVEEDETISSAFETAPPQETDADGDDEVNDESEPGLPGVGESAVSITARQNRTPADDTGSEDDFFHTPKAGRSPMPPLSNAARARLQDTPGHIQPTDRAPQTAPRLRMHERNASSATIRFAPQRQTVNDASASSPQNIHRPVIRTNTNNDFRSGATTPKASVPRSSPATPGQKVPKPNKRPAMPVRTKTAPDAPGGFSWTDLKRGQRQPSFNARALDLASEIGDNKWAPGAIDVGGISGMPASFSEQLMRERELERLRETERRRGEDEENGMVNRIMLARMHTLEEGFREVLREIKDLSQHATGSSRRESGEEAILFKARPKVETATSNPPSSSGAAGSKAPIGRIGGNVKTKKSLRKAEKKSKSERPGSALKVYDAAEESPEVGGQPAEGEKMEGEAKGRAIAADAGAERGPERPQTAVKEPGTSRGSDGK